jgi:hypothetical protein
MDKFTIGQQEVGRTQEEVQQIEEVHNMTLIKRTEEEIQFSQVSSE